MPLSDRPLRELPTEPSSPHRQPPASPLPLDLDAEARDGLDREVLGAVGRFLDELEHAPASFGPTDRTVIADLLRPPPERPTAGIVSLLETITAAARTGFDTAAGSHLSYIPSGGLYAGALGRYVGAALNRWTGASFAQPGAVALEQSVVNWMIDVFGLGPDATGLLLSGGSMANLEAVVTARSRLGDRFDDAVVYTSERAHHSVAKAARLAGIPASGVRAIAVDDDLRMSPTTLAAAVAADRAAGLRPMLVAATAGTTDTGAVDPLAACAEVAASEDLWFHVDAAYGGFFALTERGRALLDGIELADSITVDAHKSLLLPYGIGGLLVADRSALVDAHEGRGAYMQDVHADPDLPDYCALGVELSRPYRGLDVWLPLHLHGVAPFRDELDRMLDLAGRAALGLRAIPGIELVAEPTLSIVTFRAAAGEAATRAVFEHLNRSAEVHVSSTTVADRFTIRFAFLNHRTTTEIADRAVELVAEAASAIPAAA